MQNRQVNERRKRLRRTGFDSMTALGLALYLATWRPAGPRCSPSRIILNAASSLTRNGCSPRPCWVLLHPATRRSRQADRQALGH